MTVRLERGLPAEVAFARMATAQQIFAALRDPAHRATADHRQRGDQRFFLKVRDLEAEGAADIRLDHANVILGQMQGLAEQRAHRMRALRGRPEAQRLARGIVVRDIGARFHRRAGVAMMMQFAADGVRGRREDLHRIAARHACLEQHVAAPARFNQRRARRKCALGVDDGFGVIVLDVDEQRRLLRGVRILRDHGGDALTREAHAVHRQRVEIEGLRFDAFAKPFDRHRVVLRAQIVAGDDGDHARQLKRGACVDRQDARGGVGTAHHVGVRHAVEFDVTGIEPGAGDERRAVLCRYVFAYECHRQLLLRAA